MVLLHHHRLDRKVIYVVFLFLSAMEFHEHLHSIGTKEGLKERKLQKAVESFTWNITILKVPCELFLGLGAVQSFLSVSTYNISCLVHIGHWRLYMVTEIRCLLSSRESGQAH